MLVKDLLNNKPELAGLMTALTNLASFVAELRQRVSPHLEQLERWIQSDEVQQAMRNMRQFQEDMRNPVRYLPAADPKPVVEDLDARRPPLPHKRAGFTLPAVHGDED